MGNMKMDIQPASDHPTTDLLQLLNLSFENYLVPVHFDLSQFLTMLRKDNIDLNASRVLLADGKPSGIALIARRGWTSRLAAMGITKDMRGKSAGSWFMEELIREARERNDREMVLEVIEQNEAAVRLYQKYGFQTIRRLIGLIHRDAKQDAKSDLQEIDLREMGRLILQYGMAEPALAVIRRDDRPAQPACPCLQKGRRLHRGLKPAGGACCDLVAVGGARRTREGAGGGYPASDHGKL